MSDLVLVFDLDDTLYPEREFALSGFRAAGRWAAAELGIDGLDAEMTRLLDDGHLGKLFTIALAEKAPSHTPEQLAGLLEAYRNHEPQLVLFEDAAWALSHFADKARLGMITDGTHAMQARKVAALGIAPRFQEIVYTHALGGREFSKPHPAQRTGLGQRDGRAARAQAHPFRRKGCRRRRAAAHGCLARRAAGRARVLICVISGLQAP